MATIVIKDLRESTALDHQAMLAITGGSRLRGRAAVIGRPAHQCIRLFDLSAAKPQATKPPSR